MTLISFPYFQKEQKKLGMMKVYSDRFCWKKSKNNEMLIVQMRMEDFISASEPVIIMTLLIIIIVRKNPSDIFFFFSSMKSYIPFPMTPWIFKT